MWKTNDLVGLSASKKVSELSGVYVATDDCRIMERCKSLEIDVVMTSEKCKTSTERAYEVAQNISADLYVVVNGNEP